MKLDPNDPIFPTELGYGLTIRAELAKAAMQGMLANPASNNLTESELIRCAVGKADALIAELNKEETK